MPDKFNELLLKQDIIELYNTGITPDYGYLLNGRFEKDMVKTLYPLKTLNGNPITWEASETEYLFPNVSFEPKQTGSGEPSPNNVRPISGYDSVTVTQSKGEAQVKQITLTLPETIYGGTVDAVTGVGRKVWKLLTLTGYERSHIFSKFFYLDDFSLGEGIVEGVCSHYRYNLYQSDSIGISSDGKAVIYAPNGAYTLDQTGLDSWKSYLATQAAAGTPVQVAYKLATPEPFQATGNQQLTSLLGYNTIYTNGDSMVLNRKARRLEV